MQLARFSNECYASRKPSAPDWRLVRAQHRPAASSKGILHFGHQPDVMDGWSDYTVRFEDPCGNLPVRGGKLQDDREIRCRGMLAELVQNGRPAEIWQLQVQQDDVWAKLARQS
jgi:hypothetical protein